MFGEHSQAQDEMVGVLWAGPGAGLNDPNVSLPAQDILYYMILSVPLQDHLCQKQHISQIHALLLSWLGQRLAELRQLKTAVLLENALPDKGASPKGFLHLSCDSDWW